MAFTLTELQLANKIELCREHARHIIPILQEMDVEIGSLGANYKEYVYFATKDHRKFIIKWNCSGIICDKCVMNKNKSFNKITTKILLGVMEEEFEMDMAEFIKGDW